MFKRRTPSQIFREEYLRGRSVSEYCSEKHLEEEMIHHILDGGWITMDHAKLLSRSTGTTATFWLRMQDLFRT
jgi:plasmid maintenance system antidote protein VapI